MNNNNTVLSQIDGHSKRRMPLVRRLFYFPRLNSGQTFIKKLSRKLTSNQRTLFLADTTFCTNWSIQPFLSLQLADSINIFELILAAREDRVSTEAGKTGKYVHFTATKTGETGKTFLSSSSFCIYLAIFLTSWTIVLSCQVYDLDVSSLTSV